MRKRWSKRKSPWSPQERSAIKFYARHVLAGVGLLRDKVPGWTRTDKLAISDLELSSGTSCVLGQLAAKSALTSAGFDLRAARNRDQFGSGSQPFQYSDAVGAMDIVGEDYGFNADFRNHPWYEGVNEYEILNHLWVAAIRMERKGLKVTQKALREALGV